MEKQNLSGIVVYTIHGGEEQKQLRDSLRNKITSVFDAIQIDESTYGININAENRDAVVKKLEKICKEAQEESGLSFSNNDFVKFYYPTRKEESRDNRWIRHKVIELFDKK